LQKKAGITTISGWATQPKYLKTPESFANLKEWINSKIFVPKSAVKVENKN
jgi:hypothetical protein